MNSRLPLRWPSSSAALLAALFFYAAAGNPQKFAGNVAELLSQRLQYERWRWPVTIGVIAAEVIVAGLLIVPRTARVGAVLAALLLIGFSSFALFYVYVLHGEALECGCFGGIIASQLGVKTALRNLFLLVPTIVIFFGAPQKPAGASPPSLPES